MSATLTASPSPQAKPARARPPRSAREIRPGEAGESLALASSALTVVAIVCLWMLMQMLVLGQLSEHRAQHLLYGQLRGELAVETAPMGPLDYNSKPVVEGSPVAMLSIPAIGISDLVVVDGTASGDLLNGPGHLRTTQMPGEAGLSVVMGRAATYGAPFGRINQLRPGDTIEALSQEGEVTYTVKDVRRNGDPIPPAPTGATGGRLMLITGANHGFLSGLRPGTSLYVDADTKKATPAGGAFASVSPAEFPMGHDTAGLPLLALLLAILGGLVLAVSIARRHFRAALVWLVAAPVAIALAWAMTDQVMRLLPNLM